MILVIVNEVSTMYSFSRFIKDDDLPQINAEFEKYKSSEILLWAYRKFHPSIIVTSSFQTQSIPLLHLVSIYIPSVSVIFLDTGFHFQETTRYIDEVSKILNLKIKILTPLAGHKGFTKKFGKLYKINPTKAFPKLLLPLPCHSQLFKKFWFMGRLV